MKFKTLAGLISVCLFVFSSSVWGEDVYITDDGPISGLVKDGMQQFLGIPYAKKPVGELRWRPPVRPAYRSETYKAVSFGPRCAQNSDLGVFAAAGGSEDCLYLNVFRPQGKKSAKLPVLVWFHGGGLMVGSGNDYNPAKLVVEQQVIVVTFNYRLGAFGFLSVPSLDADNDVSVNYGFMDQSMALDWVHRNIAVFGGDPDNVTIAGESSGAHSVLTQMILPGSSGKFQRVIAMSGANVVNKPHKVAASISLSEATALGEGLARALGCDPRDRRCLRGKTTEEILSAQTPYIMRTQIIDGVYLRESYSEAFAKGHFSHVPLIHGSNLDEGDFFSATAEQLLGHMLSAEDYPLLIEDLTGEDAPEVLREYPLENYVNAAEAYSAVATDAIFACPALQLNRLLSPQIPVYAYEFADRTAPSYLPETSYRAKAAHTFEIPYLFVGFNGASERSTALNALQEPLAAKLRQVWAHPQDLPEVFPHWALFDGSRENFLKIALPQPEQIEQSFSKYHKCGFWSRLDLY